MDRSPATLEKKMRDSRQEVIEKEVRSLAALTDEIVFAVVYDELDLEKLRRKIFHLNHRSRETYEWLLNLQEYRS